MEATDELIKEFVRKTFVGKFTAKRQLEKSSSFDEALKFFTKCECPKCGDLLSCYPNMMIMMDATELDCSFCGGRFIQWARTGEITTK